MIRAEAVAQEKRTALRLYLFPLEEPRIIGFAGLTHILYGSFLSCFLGYKLDQREINRGYMTEALRVVIGLAFGEYGLHRIESNITPANAPSLRVMEKLGFQREGISRKYLKINGKWEDHVRYALLNESRD